MAHSRIVGGGGGWPILELGLRLFLFPCLGEGGNPVCLLLAGSAISQFSGGLAAIVAECRDRSSCSSSAVRVQYELATKYSNVAHGRVRGFWTPTRLLFTSSLLLRHSSPNSSSSSWILVYSGQCNTLECDAFLVLLISAPRICAELRTR